MDFNKTPKENIEQLRGDINRLKFMERKSYRTLKIIEENAYQISRQIILGQDPSDKFALENDLRQVHADIKELKKEIISLKSIRVDLESDVGAEYVGFGKKKLLEMKKFMLNHGIDISRKRYVIGNDNKDNIHIFIKSVNGFDTVRIEAISGFYIFLHEYGSKAIFQVLVRNGTFEINNVDLGLNIIDIYEYSGGAYVQSNNIQNEHYIILPRLSSEGNIPIYMGSIYRWGAYHIDAKLWEGTLETYRPENFEPNVSYKFFNSRGFQNYWCSGRKNYTIVNSQLSQCNESIYKAGISDIDIDSVYTLYVINKNGEWENKGIIAKNIYNMDTPESISDFEPMVCSYDIGTYHYSFSCVRNINSIIGINTATYKKHYFKSTIGNNKGLYILETGNDTTTRNMNFYYNIRTKKFEYTRTDRYSYGAPPYTYKTYSTVVNSNEVITKVAPYSINNILNSKKYELYFGNYLIDSGNYSKSREDLINPIPTTWTLISDIGSNTQSVPSEVEPGWVGHDFGIEFSIPFSDTFTEDSVKQQYSDIVSNGLWAIDVIDYDNLDGDNAFICIYTKTNTIRSEHIDNAYILYTEKSTSMETRTQDYILTYKLNNSDIIHKVNLHQIITELYNNGVTKTEGYAPLYVTCQVSDKYMVYSYILYEYKNGISNFIKRVIGIINMNTAISKAIPMGYRKEFIIDDNNYVDMLKVSKNYNYKQVAGIGINY